MSAPSPSGQIAIKGSEEPHGHRRRPLRHRLADREPDSRKIGWFEAVPAMGLDGLGSASYGPEAALTVMIPLGAGSLDWVAPVTAPIVALLVVLYLSYRQTVVAYPSNGGAYAVAKENLGRGASLLAAAAIMIDYVLNVAVGISAGIGALTSSISALASSTLPLCLAVLAVVTLANLRGTAEAGILFALPTYTFMASFLGSILVGLWQVIDSGGHPKAVVRPPDLSHATEAVGLWLLVRAFAAGCTAMTGVEAVSNGVGAFKEPVTVNAHRTLTIICVTLGLLLAGIASIAHSYAVSAAAKFRPALTIDQNASPRWTGSARRVTELGVTKLDGSARGDPGGGGRGVRAIVTCGRRRRASG